LTESASSADARSGPFTELGLVSFVLPAFNEVECLPALLDEVMRAVDAIGVDAEVVVVDDGSTDGTSAVVSAAGAVDPRIRLVRMRRNRGKAHALQTGFDNVKGEIVVLMDADGQDDPAELPKLLEAIKVGSDLVTGQRAVRHDRFVKRTTSRVYNAATRRLTGVDGRDFNSGYKVMRIEVAESLDLYGDLHRYIPVLASWQGFTVTEVPVVHRARAAGVSKFGRARFWRGCLDLLTVKFLTTYTHRPLHLFGGIGAILGTIGVLVLAWLTGEKVFGGAAIGTRPALIAGVLLVIVGIQLISLGLVAELIVKFAAREGRARKREESSTDSFG
jgi:glycosyltransferase involved in cell wall biosynthesis